MHLARGSLSIKKAITHTVRMTSSWAFPVFDHFLLYCKDLDQATEKICSITGVRPVFGGKHTGRGTHNAVVSLASLNGAGVKWPPVYLELISKDPEQNIDIPAFSFSMDDSLEGKMLHWAAMVPQGTLGHFVDTMNSSKSLRKEWPALGAPFQMQRMTPTGEVLQWTLSLPVSRSPLPADGLLPFLLDWENVIENANHPGQTAPKGITLKGMTLKHKDSDHLKGVLDELGLLNVESNGGYSINVVSGDSSEMTLHLDTPNGPVDLSEF